MRPADCDLSIVMATELPAPGARRRIRVDGIVQGVGFRPFVFGLATGLGLGGFVANDTRGVTIEVEGACERREFLARLVTRSAAACRYT